ncbi:MAG: hypothetical protein H7Y32_03655, partial [Chloroflexales bacterium]|nr:hypothetical protein [Chloroflexales bacterium]
MRRIMGALIAALALVGFVAPVGAQPASGEALTRALAWTQAQQQADGGFPGFGVGSTADAVYALAAAGQDSSKAIGYLRTNAADYAKSPGAAAKLALALAATDHSSEATS